MHFRFSKTTANGLLAFFIASVPVCQSYPELGIPVKLVAWLSFLAGLARCYVGSQQADADLVLAKIPGVQTPELVPAHPTPDDPKAKVVPCGRRRGKR